MSKKMKTYSAAFKAKTVIELLGCDITLNELASKYSVTPKSIQNWKKQFLANAKLAFNADSAVSEFKEQLKSKDAIRNTGRSTFNENLLLVQMIMLSQH